MAWIVVAIVLAVASAFGVVLSAAVTVGPLRANYDFKVRLGMVSFTILTATFSVVAFLRGI